MGDIVIFNDPVVLQILWSLHPSLKQSKNKFTDGSESAEKKTIRSCVGHRNVALFLAKELIVH